MTTSRERFSATLPGLMFDYLCYLTNDSLNCWVLAPTDRFEKAVAGSQDQEADPNGTNYSYRILGVEESGLIAHDPYKIIDWTISAFGFEASATLILAEATQNRMRTPFIREAGGQVIDTFLMGEESYSDSAEQQNTWRVDLRLNSHVIF